jgi:hypothetical protein
MSSMDQYDTGNVLSDKKAPVGETALDVMKNKRYHRRSFLKLTAKVDTPTCSPVLV